MCKPKLLIIDVDGVLCRNKLVDRQGKTIGKFFNDKNWTGIKEFKALDVSVVFLSGDPYNAMIADIRNIPFYSCMIDNTHVAKEAVYAIIKNKYGVKDSEVIYIGDDIFDIGVLKIVGWPVCPDDAHPRVKDICEYSMEAKAGEAIIMELLYGLISQGILDYPDINKVIEIDKKEHGC